MAGLVICKEPTLTREEKGSSQSAVLQAEEEIPVRGLALGGLPTKLEIPCSPASYSGPLMQARSE